MTTDQSHHNLEKVYINRLVTFLDKLKRINKNSCGFRSNRKTSLTSVDSTEEITNSLELKLNTTGIFLDPQKEFDSIDHTIL